MEKILKRIEKRIQQASADVDKAQEEYNKAYVTENLTYNHTYLYAKLDCARHALVILQLLYDDIKFEIELIEEQ